MSSEIMRNKKTRAFAKALVLAVVMKTRIKA